MRPRNQSPRDQLAAVLARRSAASASELAVQLGVSVPTLHRLLQEQGDTVIVTGKARRTRYALRRPLRGDLSELPLYAVDAAGQADVVAPGAGSPTGLVHGHRRQRLAGARGVA